MRNHRRNTSDTSMVIALTILAFFVFCVGQLCWQFEMTPGLDHTEHACSVISYIAVMGSFAGTCGLLMGLALLLTKDD